MLGKFVCVCFADAMVHRAIHRAHEMTSCTGSEQSAASINCLCVGALTFFAAVESCVRHTHGIALGLQCNTGKVAMRPSGASRQAALLLQEHVVARLNDY